MSPARSEKKTKTPTQENQTPSRAQQPEPDPTVHDDIDDSAFSQPSHEEIAVLAYSFWLDDGQQDGSADDHWHRAERELRARGRGASDSSRAPLGQTAAPSETSRK